MICYKDMTFCASDCLNRACRRNWTDEKAAAAKAWWGSDDAPVSFSDFSADCPEYKAGSQ